MKLLSPIKCYILLLRIDSHFPGIKLHLCSRRFLALSFVIIIISPKLHGRSHPGGILPKIGFGLNNKISVWKWWVGLSCSQILLIICHINAVNICLSLDAYWRRAVNHCWFNRSRYIYFLKFEYYIKYIPLLLHFKFKHEHLYWIRFFHELPRRDSYTVSFILMSSIQIQFYFTSVFSPSLLIMIIQKIKFISSFFIAIFSDCILSQKRSERLVKCIKPWKGWKGLWFVST